MSDLQISSSLSAPRLPTPSAGVSGDQAGQRAQNNGSTNRGLTSGTTSELTTSDDILDVSREAQDAKKADSTSLNTEEANASAGSGLAGSSAGVTAGLKLDILA